MKERRKEGNVSSKVSVTKRRNVGKVLVTKKKERKQGFGHKKEET